MADKVEKPITNSQFAFFGGAALCLLSLVMTLNVWVIARVLTFPFFFLLGLSSYFLFANIFVQGASLMIRKKAFRLRFSIQFVGVIVTTLSVNLLLTAFYKPTYTASTFGNFISSLNYVTAPKFLNLFTQPIAGGFIGIVLYEALHAVAAPVPFIIGFLVLFIGLAFIFMNPILSLVTEHQGKSRQPKNGAPRKVKKVKEPVENNNIVIARDNTSSVIKGASVIDKVEPATPIRSVPSMPVTQMNPNDLSMGGPNMGYNPNDSVFKPAHFIPGVIPGDTPSSMMNTPRPSVPPKEEPIVENTVAEEIPPVAEPVRGSEQLTLDFEEPKIDQSLVTAAPVFEDPISKVANNNSPPANPSPAPAPVKKKIKWVPPSADLLEVYEVEEANNANIEVAEQRTLMINQILSDYRVGAQVEGYTIGPSVTRYNVKYETNVQTRAVEAVVKDIARRLGGVMCRFEPIVRGTEYSGLEIPNARVTTVSYKDVYEQLPDVKKHPTAIAFGKNIQGEVISADFNSFPHMLVAGTTGSGKSIFIHSIISTLIMRNSPDDLKLVLVDPKRVEMVKYREIPHLLCPIINEPKKAKPLLDKLVDEMNSRYDLLAQGDGYSDINEYNEYAVENGLDKIPVIIAVLDEYGDLVETCKEISRPVLLLGQKARACGIHILIATQSPTTDIITGNIKSNLPTHVALATSNATQSVTILGEGGAEKLLGRGDMLVQCPRIERGALTRLQGCYIAGKEISRICGYLREHYEPQYDEKFLNLEEEEATDGQLFAANDGNNTSMDAAEEEKYQSIKGYVMSLQYVSISKLQGDCGIGFNRARRFFNRLVKEGIVNPNAEGGKGCRVIGHDSGTSVNNDIPVSDEVTD